MLVLTANLQAARNRTLPADYVEIADNPANFDSEECLDTICNWVEQPANLGKTLVLRKGGDVLLVAMSKDEVTMDVVSYTRQDFRKQMEGPREHGKIVGGTKACESNVKNIATALEMYSTDNAGRYPTDMKPLIPNYLQLIPACPLAKSDNYVYEVATVPDAYTVYCKGKFHERAHRLENHPAFSAYQGLIPGYAR